MVTCPWPIDVTECAATAGLDPEKPADAAKIEAIVLQVTSMLSRWSGGVFGGCATVRPLSPCGTCGYESGCCAEADCISLHGVSAVTQVRIRGDVVPETDYHFEPARGTLCAGPGLTWPRRDPFTSNIGELEVDVLTGSEPDAWALSVANELACELLLALGNSASCRIPSNAVSVSSQGIVIQLKQDDLIYSLPSVISWVNTINPHRAVAAPRIYSPELRRSSQRPSTMSPWRRR